MANVALFNTDSSLQLTTPTSHFEATEKLGLGLVGVGVLFLVVALFGAGSTHPLLMLLGSTLGLSVGGLLYFKRYLRRPAGIDNDGLMFSSSTARGALGWVLGIVFTGG